MDEEIREIRKIRHEISEACSHDVHATAEYYRKIEEELRASGEFQFAVSDTKRCQDEAA